MHEPSYLQADAKATDSGAIDALDSAIADLEETIERLDHRTSPIRSMYMPAESVRLNEPRVEPPNALRGRIERLRDLTARIQQLTSEMDL